MTKFEGIKGNDQARMPKAEGMMKSKTTSDDLEATFWKSGAEVVVREQANDNRFTIWKSEQLDSAKWLSNLREQFRKIRLPIELSLNLLVQEPALEQTTSKRMMRFRRETF